MVGELGDLLDSVIGRRISNQGRRLAVLSALVVLMASGLLVTRGWYSTATAAPTLTDLRGTDELKMLFNQDIGKVRLVMLVSPT